MVLKADFRSERWFCFDPPFHSGRWVLLHRQPDDVFRIDFQLAPDADPDVECRPESVLPRLRQMLGPSVEFELDWVSLYAFSCRPIPRFRPGPVVFVGDIAPVLSPLSTRGGNGRQIRRASCSGTGWW